MIDGVFNPWGGFHFVTERIGAVSLPQRVSNEESERAPSGDERRLKRELVAVRKNIQYIDGMRTTLTPLAERMREVVFAQRVLYAAGDDDDHCLFFDKDLFPRFFREKCFPPGKTDEGSSDLLGLVAHYKREMLDSLEAAGHHNGSCDPERRTVAIQAKESVVRNRLRSGAPYVSNPVVFGLLLSESGKGDDQRWEGLPPSSKASRKMLSCGLCRRRLPPYMVARGQICLLCEDRVKRRERSCPFCCLASRNCAKRDLQKSRCPVEIASRKVPNAPEEEEDLFRRTKHDSSSQQCSSTSPSTKNLLFCPHQLRCARCDLDFAFCKECRLSRGDGAHVENLARTLKPRTIFLDFDQTLASTKHGRDPLAYGGCTVDPELQELAGRETSEIIVITRNNHTENIRRFLEGCSFPCGAVIGVRNALAEMNLSPRGKTCPKYPIMVRHLAMTGAAVEGGGGKGAGERLDERRSDQDIVAKSEERVGGDVVRGEMVPPVEAIFVDDSPAELQFIDPRILRILFSR